MPTIYDAIRHAEPLTPIKTHRGTENRLRHFERTKILPDNFLALGDAVCAFNPVYGQGMTIAALGAMTLDESLRELLRSTDGFKGFSSRFQKKLAKVNKAPDDAKSLQAIPLLKKSAALKKESAEPYEALTRAYRNLRNWTAALKAADTSISLEPQSSDGYFSRACALARLGRTQEALKALEKAAEIDPDVSDLLGEEADLKSLASHPRFKKLLPTEAAK